MKTADVRKLRSKFLITINIQLYRVIHKSLRNFRTRLRNKQDRHSRREHIEHVEGRTENWRVSSSVDMLSFSGTIPATVTQRSEISEGTYELPCTFF